MMTFPSAHPPSRAAPVVHKFLCPHASTESRPFRSESSSQLKLRFFKSLKILCARFQCMTSFTFPGPGSFYFDICERHILPARALHMRSSFHQTNPCAESKGSQPNYNPKARIFKTKSLGHYITQQIQANTFTAFPYNLLLVLVLTLRTQL